MKLLMLLCMFSETVCIVVCELVFATLRTTARQLDVTIQKETAEARDEQIANGNGDNDTDDSTQIVTNSSIEPGQRGVCRRRWRERRCRRRSLRQRANSSARRRCKRARRARRCIGFKRKRQSIKQIFGGCRSTRRSCCRSCRLRSRRRNSCTVGSCWHNSGCCCCCCNSSCC
jgi:hypothetical protein